jgi:hypothetical protein
VIFRNGLLTIQAQNSSLAEVLTAVHHATGASLEMPPTASNERVAVNLGPAPPSQVLTSLLNGAPYDYVLLSRPENPGDLQTVIVREKAGGSSETGATQAYNTPPQPEPVEQPEAMPEQPEVQEAAPENQEQPDQPAAEQPPAEQANPAQPQPNQQPGAQQENGENQPKTPEQLLEELKRMQMQQQQQQQQQGPQQGPVPQQQPQQQQPDGQPQQQSQPDGQPQQPPQPQEADTPPQNPIQ